MEGFEKSLRQAIALNPENITVHTLTLKRASRIVIEDQKENDYADVAAMLEKCHLLAEAGYRPYYLYRQKNTLQNLENVGWCKPGHEGYYNIYIMEEVQTILSAGAVCRPEGARLRGKDRYADRPFRQRQDHQRPLSGESFAKARDSGAGGQSG